MTVQRRGESALIVGAGIGGMSTAIALRRIGFDVDIVEVDPHWKVTGAGITITGPTLRAFKDLGIYDDIVALGYVGEGIRVCDVTGATLRDLPTPIPPEAGVAGSGGITRPVLHKILSAVTLENGVGVRLGVSVDSLVQDQHGVDIAFSDGRAGRYDLVVGADGINSRTRQQILPDAPGPEYTGQSVWRMFVPRFADIDRRHYFLGGPAKVGFTPVSASQMYLFVLERTPQIFLADDELAPRLRDLLAPYGGIIARIRDGIGDYSEIVFRPLEAFHLPTPWHVGRVVLLGDAAHPTTPQLASGAGIAVEDALVLADEAAAAPSIPAALESFEARREERCRLVVESSIQIGRLEQEEAPPHEQTAIVERALSLLTEPI